MTETGGNPDKKGPSRSAVVGLILTVIIAVVGVYFVWRMLAPQPVPIGEVLSDLRAYEGTTVTVRGEVVDTFSVLSLKTFDLDDGSGRIKVVTERGTPPTGETITVTGIVDELFNIAGINYTVLMETNSLE